MEAFRKGFYSRLEGEKGEGMNPKLRLGQDRRVLIFQAESHAQWPEVKFQGNKKLLMVAHVTRNLYQKKAIKDGWKGNPEQDRYRPFLEVWT